MYFQSSSPIEVKTKSVKLQELDVNKQYVGFHNLLENVEKTFNQDYDKFINNMDQVIKEQNEVIRNINCKFSNSNFCDDFTARDLGFDNTSVKKNNNDKLKTNNQDDVDKVEPKPPFDKMETVWIPNQKKMFLQTKDIEESFVKFMKKRNTEIKKTPQLKKKIMKKTPLKKKSCKKKKRIIQFSTIKKHYKRY